MVHRLSFFLTPVIFAMSATVVCAQNNKPVRTGTFYEDRASGSTTAANFFLTFAQAPTDKFLTITNVSCAMTMYNTQTLSGIDMLLGTFSGGNDVGRVFPLGGGMIRTAPTGAANLSLTTLNNGSVIIKLGPGRYPTIYVTTANSGSSFYTSTNCVIVGTLSDN